jgi:hypothetical protein
MKKTIHVIAIFIFNFLFVVFNADAQVPQGVNYQAVARDVSGNILGNQNICVRSTITNGNGGADIYVETFNISTNQFGLFTLNIGNGIPVAIPFSLIDWAAIEAWQKIEIDIACTGTYALMGSSQLLSVPYSLYSLKSESTTSVSGTVNMVSKFTGANTVGNSQIFDNGTNVGIGTVSPQNTLDVNSASIGASARFNSIDDNFIGIYEGNVYKGYVGSYYGNSDDIDLGSTSGAVHLVTGSSIDLTASGGNVGIGNVTPTVPLDINKTSTGQVVKLNATDQVYLGFFEANTYRGYVGSFFGNAPDVDLGSQTGAVHLVTGGTIDLTADAGDIGIGITAPVAKLDINSTGTGQTVKVNAASDVFMGFWEGGGYRGYVGSYYGGIADMDLGSFAGAVHLVTGSSIDLTAKAGNIGIGTTTPAQLLHVNEPTSSDALVRVTTGAAANNAGIELERLGSGTQWRILNTGLGLYYGDLLLQSSNNTFTTPRSEFAFKESDFSNGYLRPCNDNETFLGGGAHRWITVYATNGTINTSDAREKSNVTNLTYGLSDLMQLRPVSFTWTEHPQWGTKLGLIAQEVKEVVKEVVQHGDLEPQKDRNGNLIPGPDKYGIYYSDLIPVLIKSIQDQQKIIESQEARIKALELR